MTKTIFYTGITPIQTSQQVIHTPTIAIHFILPPNLQQIKQNFSKDKLFLLF